MIELVTFVAAAYGMTQILVYGSIFDRIRPTKGKLGELFHCPMCLGFWVGVILWGANNQTQLFTYDYSPVTGFLLGCLSSGTSYALSMVFGDCGFKLEHKFLGGCQNVIDCENGE